MENESNKHVPRAPDAEKPMNHIGADLWHAFRAYEHAMFTRVASNGFEDISQTDSDVLAYVGRRGTQLVTIARQRRVSKQSVHEQVHSLVNRGYLTLAPDPDDRRAKIVMHSDKGRRFVEAMKHVKQALHKEVETALGSTHLTQLEEALATIRNRFE